jgi:hypothetical protein
MLRWTGDGGHNLFVWFLRKVATVAYGPALDERYRYQDSHAIRIYGRCGFCGLLMTGETSETACCHCYRDPIIKIFMHDHVSRGERFFGLMAKYLLMMRWPEKHKALRDVFMTNRCLPPLWDRCYGCETFIPRLDEHLTDNAAIVDCCFHVGGYFFVQACRHPWCRPNGPIIINECGEECGGRETKKIKVDSVQ